MVIKEPSPQTTLVVLLGASEWPRCPELPSSNAFTNSARELQAYLLDPLHFGIPTENFLDLFDIDESADDIDSAICDFLDQRTAEMRASGNEARDLLVYYVGHGDFAEPQADYILAIRRTRSNNPGASSIRIDSLARTLKAKARRLRRILILDCCFAAAAFQSFQSAPGQAAIQQVVDAFEEKSKGSGYAERGTALLCSSGPKVPSLISQDGRHTMFTEALLKALTAGNPHQQNKPHLTLRELASLTADLLAESPEKNAPRPYLHSPDQSYGDVADIPFFPNPAVLVSDTQPISWAAEANYGNFEVRDVNEFRIIIKGLDHVYAQTPSGHTLVGKVQMKSREERLIQMVEATLLKGESVDRRGFEDLGITLYEMLFDGEINTAFQATYTKIIEEHDPWLRVVIEFTPETLHLARLPWETIYIPSIFGKGAFISLLTRMMLTRDVTSTIPPHDFTSLRQPLRILTVVSTPSDLDKLDTEPILIPIEETVQSHLSTVVLDKLYQPTASSLLETIMRFQPDVVHFIGVARSVAGGSDIALVDEDQKTYWIDLGSFAKYFGQSRRPTSLFFLQNCMHLESKLYQKYQPYLAFRDAASLLACFSAIPAVMTTQYPMDSNQLGRFTAGFYHYLFEGNQLDLAAKGAIHDLLDEFLKDVPFLEVTPVLYLKHGFRIQLEQQLEAVPPE